MLYPCCYAAERVSHSWGGGGCSFIPSLPHNALLMQKNGPSRAPTFILSRYHTQLKFQVMIFWPRRSHQRRRWDPFYIVVYTYLCSIFRALLHIYMYFVLPMLSSFWTSCGLGCRPFSPRVRALRSYRAKGSAFPLLVHFHRMLVTQAVTISASILRTRKNPSEFIRLRTRGDSNSRNWRK